MKFADLLAIVGREPVFETGLLLAGDAALEDVHRQLSRWTSGGRIVQLRRGVYTLAPPYQPVEPHPFLIANRMSPGSYVSCQSALAHFGLIPEHVPVVTSVGYSRTAAWETPLGRFELRHLKAELLWGYERQELPGRQAAFVAMPEKALLDLIYLEPGADEPAWLEQLRLQNLDRLHLDRLESQVRRVGKPKLVRALQHLVALVRREALACETL